ncbi:D-arabinono-1,4-lactone oxidase [Tenacibaculum ovolyticum]|uniref:D-arabinono-1,4-lactone oxidase n=1 Tax=Tenacibaculum ovolyticum TaxID=104270 RepID=UPI0003FD8727|nr:D-arabinono-1,4-lactone oxidase [Tenacibaculum ovolyticum]
MKNWAENVQWNPSEIAYPSTEIEIQQVVLKAANSNKKIRTIGTGHSFTALSQTSHILVSLDKYQGLLSINKEKCQATVKGGTKLKLLGELLFNEGLAMENLGDIDSQSIAGAISTGTHGTGIGFGSISTQVIELKFINGKGDIIECSTTKNEQLFKAASLSLGCLGIITEITIQCVPSYKLTLQNNRENIHDVLATLDQRNKENRNFEFFWIPYTDTAWTKTTNIVENTAPDKDNFFNYWTEFFLENHIFKLVCEFARYFPSQNKTVAKITAANISTIKKVYYSHKIFATPRIVKFREMEYNIPSETYKDVFKDVQNLINKKKFNIHFPIENRWVKGDDLLLSPAYKRDSTYIACHVYNKKECEPYFTALEEIFRAYDGRPHWGKMNTLKTNDISTMYPEFTTFMQLRKENDPNGVFINPYLKKLFSI